MAVTSNAISARLRLADGKQKTVVTYGGIKPDATPADVLEFTGALEMLRSKYFGFVYMTVESELEDDM